MATLTGSTIASTYTYLLKMDGTSGVTSSLVKVEDGDATDTSLSVSTVAISVDATDKIYLDAGSDTYLHEVSADKLDIVVGGQTILELAEGGGGASDYMAIQALNKLYLDGGGNTYLHESAADTIGFLTGGSTRFVLDDNSRISLSNNDGGNTGNTIFGKSAFNTSSDNASDYNTAVGELAMGTGSVAGSLNCVAVGYKACEDITGGDYNVAVGSSALGSITDSDSNTAVGTFAGQSLAGGVRNTLLGYGTLASADGDEDYNVCVGFAAGTSINADTADNNVLIGFEAGVGGAAAMISCVAIGANAMNSTASDAQTGTVAIGESALTALTSGAGNTAVGYQAGTALTTGAGNTVLGYLALDAADDCDNNVVIGHSAMGQVASAEADSCVAIGHSALQGTSATDGDGTVAIGFNSLTSLTTGAGNVAVGFRTLQHIQTGARNVVIGHGAMDAADGAESDNIAIGYDAMGDMDNNGALKNIAIGSYAGNNMAGFANVRNVFIGYDSGGGAWANNASSYNTAVGNYSMAGPQDGALGNAAFGYAAGYALTAGTYNTMMGYDAGNAVTGGDFNVCIGYASDAAATADNQIAIGNSAITGASECITIGTGITNSTTRTVKFGDAGGSMVSLDWDTGGDSTWVRSSDIRKKRNIKDSDLGLEFINKLRTVTYQWKPQNEFPKEWEQYSKTNTLDTEKVHLGFIAQELKALIDEYDAPDEVASWSEDPDGMQRAGETKLITPLIKAFQELSEKNDVLEAKVKALEDAQ